MSWAFFKPPWLKHLLTHLLKQVACQNLALNKHSKRSVMTNILTGEPTSGRSVFFLHVKNLSCNIKTKRLVVMKKVSSLILGLSIFINSSLLLANDIKTYTCIDLYKREIKRKTKVKELIGEVFAGGSSVGALQVTGTIVGSSAVVLPVFIGTAALGLLAMTIWITPTKGERALLTLDETTKKFNKILKSAKKINPNISEYDIEKIIQNGFDQGTFCEDIHLASYHDIKNHVLSQVKNEI